MMDNLRACAQENANGAQLCRTLGLDKLLGFDVSGYFTCSADVIAGRQRVFRCIDETPGLFESFERIFEKLEDLTTAYESTTIGINRNSNEITLNSVCAINAFISFIETSYAELRYFDLGSKDLEDFFGYIKKEKESPEFAALKANVEKITENVRYAKSVTIGVNLDANMRPLESGLVSVNTQPYRSSSFLDKLFGVSFNDPKDFECLVPISELGSAANRDEIATINFKLNNALNKVLGKQFKKLDAGTKEYMEKMCADLTGMQSALDFYLFAVRFFRAAREKGLPTCLPKISDGGNYSVNGLYNERIANAKGVGNTVPNSLVFDDAGKVYVLTGANSGGKTVFLESLAEAQTMFQLGLPVFARSAEMFPFDNIRVYFVTESEDEKNLYGRFENEAVWFSENIKAAGKRDLFIMDELFSGTSAGEACEIALSSMKMINARGGYGVFSTHLHELAKTVSGHAGEPEFKGLDNLTVETDGDVRSYSVARKTPDSFESKAVSIARKYGII